MNWLHHNKKPLSTADISMILQNMADYGCVDVLRHPTDSLQDVYRLNDKGVKFREYLELYIKDKKFRKKADKMMAIIQKTNDLNKKIGEAQAELKMLDDLISKIKEQKQAR